MASVFYKSQLGSVGTMTLNSGIRKILPDSKICDFEFEPCGYSMNSIEGAAISTIHVTPEDGFIYASFETVGYYPKDVASNQLISPLLCMRKLQELCLRTSVFKYERIQLRRDRP